jgi:hypothetical protein
MGMLELVYRFHLGWNGLNTMQVRVLLPILYFFINYNHKVFFIKLYMYSYNLMVKSVSSKDLLSVQIRLTVVFNNIMLFFIRKSCC